MHIRRAGVRQYAAGTNLYGFVQLPLYQYANPDPVSPYGQLTAPWSLSLGLSKTF